MVIAAHDPLVGLSLAFQDGDHVIDGLQTPVRLDGQMRLDRIDATDVIGDRQAAPEVLRRQRSPHSLQKRLGVGIGDGQGGDVQQRRRRLARQTFGVLGRADARRQRIARIDHHLLDRAALDPVGGAQRPLGVGIALAIAVISRIGIDQGPDGAMLFGQLRLQTAPALAIAGDDNLALDRNAQPFQRQIVFGHTVIDIDKIARDIAVALIGDIGRQGLVGLGRGGILRDGRFMQGGAEGLGTQELQLFRQGGGIEHLEGLDPGVETKLPILGQQELGIGVVVGRADIVGLRGQPFHPALHFVRRDRGVKTRFQLFLGQGVLAGKPQQRARISLGGGGDQRAERN